MRGLILGLVALAFSPQTRAEQEIGLSVMPVLFLQDFYYQAKLEDTKAVIVDYAWLIPILGSDRIDAVGVAYKNYNSTYGRGSYWKGGISVGKMAEVIRPFPIFAAGYEWTPGQRVVVNVEGGVLASALNVFALNLAYRF